MMHPLNLSYWVLFYPKYGIIEVWAVAMLAWVHHRRARAAASGVSGTRVRIKTFLERDRGTGNRLRSYCRRDAPANVMLGFSGVAQSICPLRGAPGDAFRGQGYILTSNS